MSYVKKKYLNFIKKQEISGERFIDKHKQLDNFYMPLSTKLFNQYKSKNGPFLIGISGGQGSGKSTITQIFKIILPITIHSFFKLIIVGELWV